MNAQPDLDNIIRRTRRYEFEDGLRDFQLAVLFGLSGLSVWLAFAPSWLGVVAKAMQRFGRWAAWVNLAPLLLAPLAVWGALRFITHLRRTWLWRESGMVKPARRQVPRRVNVTAALIIIGGILAAFWLRSFGLADDGFVLRMLWSATGWAFGYVLYSLGRDIGLPRYVWLGAAGGLVSTVVLLLPLEFGNAALVCGLIWAILLTISGAIGLRRAAQLLQARR